MAGNTKVLERHTVMGSHLVVTNFIAIVKVKYIGQTSICADCEVDSVSEYNVLSHITIKCSSDLEYRSIISGRLFKEDGKFIVINCESRVRTLFLESKIRLGYCTLTDDLKLNI